MNLFADSVRYIQSPDLDDVVSGFVQTESNPDFRFNAIMSAFKRLADAAQSNQ